MTKPLKAIAILNKDGKIKVNEIYPSKEKKYLLLNKGERFINVIISEI